jgi:multidrug efflux pump subunit AcrA (membrane-fusion protein)
MLLALLGLFGCKGKNDQADTSAGAPAADSAAEEVRTPVTVTTPTFGTLQDSIELNATSTFLQSAYVRSIAMGYVRDVLVKPGEYVPAGKPLFTIETKEAKIIGNTISKLDSGFRFSGKSVVKANQSGYITQLNHQAGDYVQDAEQLAVISDNSSFVFLLNLPYELRPYVLNRRNVDLYLPDNTHLTGVISTVMPVVDSATQTQQVAIKVSNGGSIPQNLIAKVKVIKELKLNAQLLPKEAVLSDEAQTSFWVMKMTDSITAVKTIVKKGLEKNGKIEIIDPVFSKNDQILVTGNYGLPDTAKVRKQ